MNLPVFLEFGDALFDTLYDHRNGRQFVIRIPIPIYVSTRMLIIVDRVTSMEIH